MAGAGAAAGAVALGGWTPAVALPAPGSAGSSQASTLPVPPAFPDDVPLVQQGYVNWAGDIRFDAVWTATARTPDDVVRIANWALDHGYRVRAKGTMHGWSPLTVVPGENVERTVLVDTMTHLNAVTVHPGAVPATVTAAGGASLEAILTALQDHGLGWANSPAIGDLSIAGVLAIGAHGATYPAAGETVVPGQSFGSLSNLVTALTAVVWDADAARYGLREFTRADPEITALLTHLGRSFVTSVTLQAGTNTRLRCRSIMDVPWQELFAPPGAPGRTYESFAEQTGRVEAIWFPFTDKPWLKTWTPTPVRPSESREVFGPYNYFFTDRLPEPLTDLLGQVASGIGAATPAFGIGQLAAVQAGLALTDTDDLWGWSKDVLFYLRHTTMRVTAGGGVVVTARKNIARVIHEFTTWHNERMTELAARGEYPINGPFEVRMCGVDDPAEVLVDSAGPPNLSPVRPRPDRPEWDTCIWMNVVTLPGTPGASAYFRDMERWMARNYSGDYATFRSEWSKGWAFTGDGGYRDPEWLTETLPAAYTTGIPAAGGWTAATESLDAHDPHRIFANSFHDRLLP
ncbi:cholesterol oxidase substrate-binding domain-containing protein [Prescottella sp. R16]|uniref:cholesterol oxidase substrate-binding domain-containing protein n=1 Tax=Prescottella sp. R16 TaxID=3064529 RepID=UPI00272DC856|nr:cholesterol oxidase substrate-binding domain-containing protein [Prescottella sp. R16]